MKNIEVLVPEAKVKYGKIKMAEKTLELNGRIIGFLWNNKPNGDLLLGKLKDLFKEKFRVSNTLTRKKLLPSSKTPEEILEELSSKCSLIILAIGD